MNSTIEFLKLDLKNQKQSNNISTIELSLNSSGEYVLENSERVDSVLNSLNEDQRKAFNIIFSSNKNIFLTGDAGTGKSYLIDTIIKNNIDKKIVVLAPTARAALNIGGQTIHSFFKLPPKIINVKELNIIPETYSNIDILIIDEISMVRSDLFDAIEHCLRYGGRDNSKLFGGHKIILVGDLAQISPVLVKEDQESFYKKYNTYWFFGANCFNSKTFKVKRLKIPMRQDNLKFLKLLDRIRFKDFTIKDLKMLNERVDKKFNIFKNKDYIGLVTTNDDAKSINDKFLDKLEGKSKIYKAKIEGMFSITENNLPVEKEITLKIGAKVIFIKNGHSWKNGSTGIITELNNDKIKVNINEMEVEVGYETWESKKYDSNQTPNIFGKFNQLPIKLGYAITIHRAQGMTFNKVYINFGKGAFVHGQVYVALSRCSSFEGIVLAGNIKKSDIIIDDEVLEFTEKYMA